MILFFTYHRVCPPGDRAATDFYTVPTDRFERQLAQLAQSGFPQLSVPELLAARPAPTSRCLLSFDDGTADHYEVVLPLLARHGFRAVFFVLSAKLNRPGYLTDQQVRELARAGHTIGSHGHEHVRLDELGDEDVRVQVELSQRVLGEILGAAPELFAPPGGFMNRRVQTIALECGARAIRTMRWGYNRHVNLAALETIPLTRYTTDLEFERILRLRNLAAAYGVKQAVKRFIPSRSYFWLRSRLFRWLKGR